MYEVESKVLEVNPQELAKKLEGLGAKKTLGARLFVDWFRPQGEKDGQENWYLRIRTYSDGKTELTWKGKSDKLGIARKHSEINLIVGDHRKAADFLLSLGFELYAHQEKDRTSWILKDWRLDLDQYPKMPAYLEIEGKNEKHIQEAVNLLNLAKHKKSNEGERILIQSQYGLDWYNMRF